VAVSERLRESCGLRGCGVGRLCDLGSGQRFVLEIAHDGWKSFRPSLLAPMQSIPNMSLRRPIAVEHSVTDGTLLLVTLSSEWSLAPVEKLARH